MIIEELRAIKAFGSAIESSVTLEEIKEKEKELGTSLPEALKDFYLTFDKNDPMFSAKNKFIPLHELKITERIRETLIDRYEVENVEVITFYTYGPNGIYGLGFLKCINSEENDDSDDPHLYYYFSEPKNQRQTSISKFCSRSSSRLLAVAAYQQLCAQNSFGAIKSESLKYDDQDAISKLFNMFPVGLAENNISPGRACLTKGSNLYSFINIDFKRVFVSASSPNLVEDFMESHRMKFDWLKLNGKLLDQEKYKPVKRRPLESIEPAIQTLNSFIRVLRPEPQVSEITEIEQRIKATIPEPLKQIHFSILPQFLRAPDHFVPLEELENEDGKIRFFSTDQGILNYFFEDLSPVVHELDLDYIWHEYGILDGFIVAKLFWNVMNNDSSGVVLAELEGCSKYALSSRGALGKALVPCFQKLTKNHTQQLYHSPQNDIIALYDTQLKTLFVASVGEKPLEDLERKTKIEFSWLY